MAGAAAKKILVVEDDETVRTLLVRQLQTVYEVHQAADAQAALKMLEQIHAPDLIICDVMMPGMTGVQFAKHLRGTNEYKQVPIIFLTARTGALDVIEGINAGARHYITKPFNMKDLLDKVAKVMK
jgi:DNA-binding response OmpR family regulator